MGKITFFSVRSFPQAIIHIDGDAFFASCEQAMNPTLKGKCVVTGKERGIASAMSYEAKRRGVTRGMPLWHIRKVCPEAIILPSNYEAYSLYSMRMYEIVRRYTPAVEEYSIDECFADISGMRRAHHMSYMHIAGDIKKELERELGITFSVGLAPNKVLAKIGSKWNKPSGLTIISGKKAHEFLLKTPIEKIWGIGAQTTLFLKKHGIHTAYEFASKPEWWVRKYMSKPYEEIYKELRTEYILPLNLGNERVYKSISKTKTFSPSSNEREYVFSQLSKNIESACIKARRHNLRTNTIAIFIKDDEFNYFGTECKFAQTTNTPLTMINIAHTYFDSFFDKNKQYRATGVVLKNLTTSEDQPDLFGENMKVQNTEAIFASVDQMNKKYGKHTLFLGSSFLAQQGRRKNMRRAVSDRNKSLLKGESVRKRVNIPWLGEVA